MSEVVVNVKVAYIRPTYNNLKEWVDDSSKNVYIGRKGIVFVDGERFPKQESLWANPYKISKTTSREDVLRNYEKYIREKIKKEHLIPELAKLKNKNLGCWCKPEACHGDVLLKLIDELV
jgi:hypothetical protein